MMKGKADLGSLVYLGGGVYFILGAWKGQRRPEDVRIRHMDTQQKR